MKSRFLIRIVLLVAGMMTISPSAASGILTMPPVRENLRSYRVCLDRLKTAMAADRVLVRSKRLDRTGVSDLGQAPNPSVELQSNGIVHIGPGHSRYVARIWYHSRTYRSDLQQNEYSHSWEEHSYECQDRMLVTITGQGYTLSTFEPLKAMPEK